MTPKKTYIYSNDTGLSRATRNELYAALIRNGFEVLDRYQPDADLLVCIGGDGTFLKFIHECDFPVTPIIGINTGHLGFFQELMPNQIGMFLRCYLENDYTIQTLKPVEAFLTDPQGVHEIIGLNEVLIRGPYSNIVHFSVIMEDTKIQEFIGDGILVSTPAGSTAYNYSLGGSLVAPELEVLQLTPLAPMNTSAYRSFRSSIMYPASKRMRMITRKKTSGSQLLVSYDGLNAEFSHVSKIDIVQSTKEVHIIRLSTYDYWSKLTSKLL